MGTIAGIIADIITGIIASLIAGIIADTIAGIVLDVKMDLIAVIIANIIAGIRASKISRLVRVILSVISLHATMIRESSISNTDRSLLPGKKKKRLLSCLTRK